MHKSIEYNLEGSYSDARKGQDRKDNLDKENPKEEIHSAMLILENQKARSLNLTLNR